MSEQEWRTGVPLPETSVMVSAVEVVLYLDGDGEERYRVRFVGRPSGVLGMLTLAAHDVVAKRNRDYPLREGP